MSHDRTENHDMAWANSGRCSGVDPDLFFPERGQDAGPAKALCRQCPVRAACLSWALDTGQKHGIWGGMTESQRRRLRRTAPADLAEAHAAPVRHLHLVR